MINTTDESNERQDPNTESQQAKKLRQIWNFLFTGREAMWTALFTGALVVFTYNLAQVSSRQNKIAVSSQRGFVTFVGPNPGARLIDNSGIWVGNEIALNWINSGNTAARNVIIQNNASPFFPDLPEKYSFPLVPPKTKVVIGPKGTYGVNVQMPKDLVIDYFNHKKRLFMWGAAMYSDTFDGTPKRLSEFCVELTHLTINVPDPTKVDFNKPDVNLLGFQWQQCSDHNCYDEDCKDYGERIKDMQTP